MVGTVSCIAGPQLSLSEFSTVCRSCTCKIEETKFEKEKLQESCTREAMKSSVKKVETNFTYPCKIRSGSRNEKYQARRADLQDDEPKVLPTSTSSVAQVTSEKLTCSSFPSLQSVRCCQQVDSAAVIADRTIPCKTKSSSTLDLQNSRAEKNGQLEMRQKQLWVWQRQNLLNLRFVFVEIAKKKDLFFLVQNFWRSKTVKTTHSRQDHESEYCGGPGKSYCLVQNSTNQRSNEGTAGKKTLRN